MVPYKDGKANHGHSCVKGRFAWGYATHKDRVTKPMIRAKITDPWREVSWDEAISHAASEFRRIQAKYGKDSVGGITSSRCTNEETYLVQKLIRAAFRNNNVDTCARVCHSPTGYGLKTTLGTSAGTQDFDSVLEADVILVIGANPTDAHPVFASRMKKRLREGAKLIVIDPRAIDLVRTPHVQANYHLQLRPGTNVALNQRIGSCDRDRGLGEGVVCRRALRSRRVRILARLHCGGAEFPRGRRIDDRRAGRRAARRRPPLRHRRQRHDLLRAWRYRAQPGLDHGHVHGQPGNGDGKYRPRRGRG
jgi:predicted molibdopterin-dependent oxidoreductase YjgC